jgi:hypothetical protein
MSNRVAAVAERVLKEAAAAGVSWQGGIVYAGGLAALWADAPAGGEFRGSFVPYTKEKPTRR